MTEVFLSTCGYLITGAFESIFMCVKPEEVEDNIFLYQLLYDAITEIKNLNDQVTVYNDSRLIEELNGVIKTNSNESHKWLLFIRRNVIPKTKCRIFFNKRSAEFVSEKIKQNGLLDKRKISHGIAVNKVIRKQNNPKRFKSKWFRTNSD